MTNQKSHQKELCSLKYQNLRNLSGLLIISVLLMSLISVSAASESSNPDDCGNSEISGLSEISRVHELIKNKENDCRNLGTPLVEAKSLNEDNVLKVNSADDADDGNESAESYAKDRIIVRFDMDEAGGTLSGIPDGHKIELYSDLMPGLAIVYLPENETAESALEYYSKLDHVIYAKPDYVISAREKSSGKNAGNERKVVFDQEIKDSGNFDSETSYSEISDSEVSSEKFNFLSIQSDVNSSSKILNANRVSNLDVDDPYYILQWSMENIGQMIKTDWMTISGNSPIVKGWYDIYGTPDCDIDANRAKKITTGSPEVIVAVVDTGVLYTHPDLAENIFVNRKEIPGNGIDDDRNGFVDDVNGWDFVDNDNMPLDPDGHGTHCAGTIAAVRNGIGTTGLAENVTILPIRYLDENGDGYWSDEIKSINYAKKWGQALSAVHGEALSIILKNMI